MSANILRAEQRTFGVTTRRYFRLVTRRVPRQLFKFWNWKYFPIS